MIVNTSNPADGKRYTDEKTAQVRDELGAVIEAYIADHLDAVLEANGFGERVTGVEARVTGVETRLGAVETKQAALATASKISGSVGLSVVEYNSDGIVIAGKPLTAVGALSVREGEVSHRASPLPTGVYGGVNKAVEITTDPFGHVTEVKAYSAYAPSTLGAAGQVLRSDGVGYVPEAVASSVSEGDFRLVTAGAVHAAISHALTDTSLYTVKGSCTYDELITKTTARVGDVYNISSGRYAGANFVCIVEGGRGSASWDKMSETIDLTDYAKRSELDGLLSGDELDQHRSTAASTTNWGHVISSDIIPPASEFGGSGSRGTAGKVSVFARADHQHPPQTKVEEAVRLSTPRTIALGGGLSGEAAFDGTKDIVLTAAVLTGKVEVGDMKPVSGDEVAKVVADLESAVGSGVGDREFTHAVVEFTIPAGSQSGAYDCGNPLVDDSCDIIVYYGDEDMASEGELKVTGVSEGVVSYAVGAPSDLTEAVVVRCVVLFGGGHRVSE